MNKQILKNLYLKQNRSVSEIAKLLFCSENKINYWLAKYEIPKRPISHALYLKHNKNGDPFKLKKLKTIDDYFIFGLGLGLYWGEGNKLNRNSIKLGNTNPYLIKKFMNFLEKIYNVDRSKYRFGIQLFNDSNVGDVLKYWVKFLNVNKTQFQKIVISKIRGQGTYKNKSKYGVLTIYFNNVKLRNIIIKEIEKLSQI